MGDVCGYVAQVDADWQVVCACCPGVDSFLAVGLEAGRAVALGDKFFAHCG